MNIVASYIDRQNTNRLLENKPTVFDQHIEIARRLGVGESYAIEPVKNYSYKSKVQHALKIKLKTNVCTLDNGNKVRLITRVA